MDAKAVTPILNVSDIVESFAWFEKLGWKKGFDWGNPPTSGSRKGSARHARKPRLFGGKDAACY